MQITIQYAAQVKQAIGKPQEQLEVAEGASVADALQQVASHYGDDVRRMLCDDTGGIHPALLLFVGEERVLPGQQVGLSDGATITMMSAISGG